MSPEPEKVVIVIELNPATNQVAVQGPLENGWLFNGLLEMARIVYLEHRAKNALKVIEPGPLPLPWEKGTKQ